MRLSHIFGKSKNKEINPEDIFLDATNISKINRDELVGSFERPIHNSIFIFLSFIVIMFLGVFFAKAYEIQIVQGEKFLKYSENNYIKERPVFSYRGVIKDRNGILLAWNQDDDLNDPQSVPKRIYTDIPGFSSVLGYVQYPKKDSSGIFWRDDFVGVDGIEKFYNKDLSGINGKSIVEVGVDGKVVKDNTIEKPADGKELSLNIDAKIQEIFYQEIKNIADKSKFVGGAGIMMDVNTGEIVAMVSYPEYNNNVFSNGTTTIDHDKIQEYLLSDKHMMLNRVTNGLFTPGSTVKPFMAYAALDQGVIDPYKSILSTGALVIRNPYGGPDSVFKDWKVHGYVDMRHAIAVSSDEYFYQIGGGYKDQKGLGIKKIGEYAKKFGFGLPTGVDLPKEIIGVVPSPEWKAENFADGDWLLGNTYHTVIGQYGFQVTPIELVRSVAAIANGGKLITPRLYGSSTEFVDLNLDKGFLKVVREGMALSASEGTAKAIDVSYTTKAGKTGTAEIGAYKEHINSWIMGYFPYEEPKYAFVVLMEKAPKGTLFGAPAAMRNILDNIHIYNPDFFNFK